MILCKAITAAVCQQIKERLGCRSESRENVRLPTYYRMPPTAVPSRISRLYAVEYEVPRVTRMYTWSICCSCRQKRRRRKGEIKGEKSMKEYENTFRRQTRKYKESGRRRRRMQEGEIKSASDGAGRVRRAITITNTADKEGDMPFEEKERYSYLRVRFFCISAFTVCRPSTIVLHGIYLSTPLKGLKQAIQTGTKDGEMDWLYDVIPIYDGPPLRGPSPWNIGILKGLEMFLLGIKQPNIASRERWIRSERAAELER